jgi:hypothetical protein
LRSTWTVQRCRGQPMTLATAAFRQWRPPNGHPEDRDRGRRSRRKAAQPARRFPTRRSRCRLPRGGLGPGLRSQPSALWTLGRSVVGVTDLQCFASGQRWKVSPRGRVRKASTCPFELAADPRD